MPEPHLGRGEERPVTDDLLDDIEAKRRAADVDYLSREIPQAIEQSLEGLQHVAGIVGTMKEFAHPASGQSSRST